MASVTKSRVAPARKRRADAIERVLAAVEELLADGELFTELPVARIAQRSGIPRSSFYQYFPNKSQVLVQVAELASETFFAAPAGWFARPNTHEEGVRGVERVIATMVEEYRKHWTVMRALGELSSYDPDAADFWLGRVNDHIEMMATKVAGWKSSGLVDASVDPHGATTAMVWMVERSVSQHVLRPVPGRALTDQQLVTSLPRAIWLTYFAASVYGVSC